MKTYNPYAREQDGKYTLNGAAERVRLAFDKWLLTNMRSDTNQACSASVMPSPCVSDCGPMDVSHPTFGVAWRGMAKDDSGCLGYLDMTADGAIRYTALA